MLRHELSLYMALLLRAITLLIAKGLYKSRLSMIPKSMT